MRVYLIKCNDCYYGSPEGGRGTFLWFVTGPLSCATHFASKEVALALARQFRKFQPAYNTRVVSRRVRREV